VNGTLLAKPSQAKPSQIHLNLILGFTALDSSENAFSLRNQGKRRFFIFTHIVYQLFMPPSHQGYKGFSSFTF